MNSLAGFSLQRWLLAPRTTWRARWLRAAHPHLSCDQAWVLARLHRHPEEAPYAHAHLRRHISGPQD
ncbi:hypothetical protein [Streptomyces sp. ISID311]|uniref:hypothetical protein n=1 Tax=Streptomyces sp. ISID311 TaxID=2601673 RepID=UPI0011BD412C|nr:hypothetical protein [Streptomyces sp. ISID311]TXC97734.1 hypothetical protein FS847_10025 [Streptomyces sp. ISID311]